MGESTTPSSTGFSGATSSAYERIFGAVHEAWSRIASECAFPNDGAGMSILDVGSGPGEPACLLKQTFPRAEVTSTDPEADMVDKAKARAGKLGLQLGFNICSAADLSAFPDASFDVVTANFVLMFVPDKRRMLEEAMRVLKPEGRLILTVWRSMTLLELAFEMTGREIPTEGAFPLVMRAPGSVEAIVREAGLCLAASEECSLTMSWVSDEEVDRANFLFFARRFLESLPEAERAAKGDDYLKKMAEAIATRGLKGADGTYRFPGQYQLAVIGKAPSSL